MTEADAEDRDASEQLLNIFDSVTNWLRIARSIREEHAIGLEIEHFSSTRLSGNDPHIAMMIDQQAQNVLLDAEIICRDAKFGRI